MNYLVPKRYLITFLAFYLFVMFCGTGACQTVDYSTLSITELQKKIASFKLGFGSYVVGEKLSVEQQAVAQKNANYKSYPGTIKFNDQGIFVIADQETQVVIAIYKRNKEVVKEDFKKMVGDLMFRFGEPTAEAHGKTIYWNYGPDGLISEELYRTAKGAGKLETLIVLATVKFNSSQNVDVLAMDMQKKGQEEEKTEVTSDNYVMIQSDMLSKKYMGK